MAPKAFQRPPDLNTRHEELDEVSKSIDAIILSQDQHHVTSKLHSGTIRIDKLMATPEELAEAKRIKSERRKASNLANGSADIDGSYEPGLELKSEATPPAPPLGDSTTTRIDR